MRILFILLLSTQILICKNLYSLSDEQKVILEGAYAQGKPHGFELTLATLAWQESSFGKKMYNISDGRYGSYGVYQVLIDTIIKRLQMKNTHSNRKSIRKTIIEDFDLSSKFALAELLYWKHYWKDRRKKVHWYKYTIASYNAGFKSFRSRAGKKYWYSFKKKLKIVKKYFKEQNNIKYTSK